MFITLFVRDKNSFELPKLKFVTEKFSLSFLKHIVHAIIINGIPNKNKYINPSNDEVNVNYGDPIPFIKGPMKLTVLDNILNDYTQ